AHLRAQAEKLGRDEPVAAGYTAVAELNEVGEALQHASRDRLAAERERQELLASLHAALERAEEAGRAKDQFLAMLGHELRNPLAPIVAALELMQLKADAATAREREIMGRHITHMTRLIGDLLDVARIVQGKLRMRNEVVNLRSVVERALEASQEPADIRVEIEPGEVWVRGDDTRLFQVVTNLLSNALRYCPQGEVRLHLWIEGQQARIAVHDKGVGMTPETAARVFDTFFQAPQSVARASGGLGLGLAIVRTIVDMHGGKVSARSAGPGQGSTFEDALPLAAGPEPKQQQALPAKVAQGGEVLVVDDNADAAATLGELLRLTGYSVRLAHSAAEGLALFAERAPDAAILDIGLPDMDGLALARALRERYPDWRGALVALSGYGQDGDKARAQEAGFDLHLTKPADPQELMAALGQLIPRKMQNEGITEGFSATH
ncbi:MAG TPA: ATP-binding protein, partial [Noviherbaspirillum sp.]